MAVVKQIAGISAEGRGRRDW